MPANTTKSSSYEVSADSGTTAASAHPKGHHDVTREIFETIVFVVVLVLMLKLFVAEAFVIPTGSMASTLWGDQVVCTCRECGDKFPVNASDSSNGKRRVPDQYVCENCGFRADEKQTHEDCSPLSVRDYVLGLPENGFNPPGPRSVSTWELAITGIGVFVGLFLGFVVIKLLELDLKQMMQPNAVPPWLIRSARFAASIACAIAMFFLITWLLNGSPISSGDRVLVSKYEYHLHDPSRFNVPVFKYPREPFNLADYSGMNYIKRLVGLGGETIAVFNGDLYVTRDLTYQHIPPEKRPQRETEARWAQFMYQDDPVAKSYFEQGKFQIVRKEPKEILAMRRLVFDLDKQPISAVGVRRTRWHPVPHEKTGWEMESAGFKHSGAELGWVRYQHIDPWDPDPDAVKPYLIVDFLAYNSRDTPEVLRGTDQVKPFMNEPKDHWVSDLVLDCTVDVPSADSQIVLELAKGRTRCQAIFAGGECKLVRIVKPETGKEERHEMGSHATKITKGGKYALRFANFDARLTVWVDDQPIPFAKDQTDYPPPDPKTKLVPFDEYDKLQPARIGAQGDVVVSKVSLWRDLHYRYASGVEGSGRSEAERIQLEKEWKSEYPPYSDLQTYYVQPGHYLMFGDNVNSSADSRYWGLVPQRLMLGRAIVVYWPPSRLGVIE